MKNNIFDLYQKKKKKEKIVMTTAYSHNIAVLIDEYSDIMLVGDSLGMVVYGMDSTLPVTIDMIINHAKAVVKATKKSFVIVDMPFGSYQKSKEQAFKNACKILKATGADSVKLEGGIEMAETIDFLSNRGVLVVAHIGLQPQSVNIYGGYKVQTDKDKIINDAKAVAKAGAKILVLEAIKENIADQIVEELPEIITIAIGASKKCDGQVLVTDDLLGICDKTAKFVKKYADLSKNIKQAVKKYSEEVKKEKFPEKKHLY